MIMLAYIKFSVIFCSLLPVVLPCIYASELFMFDASKKDLGIEKAVHDSAAADQGPGNSIKQESLSMEEALKIQQVKKNSQTKFEN